MSPQKGKERTFKQKERAGWGERVPSAHIPEPSNSAALCSHSAPALDGLRRMLRAGPEASFNLQMDGCVSGSGGSGYRGFPLSERGDNKSYIIFINIHRSNCLNLRENKVTP